MSPSVCIVTKRLKLGSCNFHYNVAQCLPSLIPKFKGNPLDRGRGAQTRQGWFSIEFATLYLGNGTCEIGSHIWTFDCNKSWWPWMTSNVNLLLCRQCYAYCYQTDEARIMQFQLKSSPMPYLLARQVWLHNSKGIPSIWGLKIGWGVFDFATLYLGNGARCSLWQLITSRKSWAFDCNTSRWLWITVNVNSLLCRQFYACCDQIVEARITRFSL